MYELVLEAGWLAKVILLILLVGSVTSLAVIAFKWRELRSAREDTEVFLEAYLERPPDAAFDVAKRTRGSPIANLYSTGYRELTQLMRQLGPGASVTPDQIEIILKRLGWVKTGEAHRLERGLSYLATVASAAPFVGLLGTVIGIMNAFQDIGTTGSASLAVVAPGIAEALVATAAGLGAAIPAVIAYNYVGSRVTHMLERMDDFGVEYAESLRQAAGRAA